MKLVEDPMFCHSTVVYEPDSKPFQHNGSTLVDAGLKEGNEILKEEQNGNLFGLKGYEKETDPLPFELNNGDRLWKTPDLHCYVSVDSLRNGNKNEVRDSVAPYTISSSKTELLEETDLYTDKGVMECELPELIVCYKESYNPDVKDICVDEGVPSTDKILVENGEEEPVGFCTSFSPDREKDSDLIKEKVDIELPALDELKVLEQNSCNNFEHSDTNYSENIDITNEKVNIELSVLEELKSSEVNACNHDTFHQSASEEADNIVLTKAIEYNEMPGTDELKSSEGNACGNQNGETINGLKDKIESNGSKEEVVPEYKLLEQDSGRDNSVYQSSEIDGNEVEQPSIQMPSGDTVSAKPTLDSAAEESNNSSIVDELSYNSKVESGRITFDFESSTPVASGETEGPQNVDLEPPIETPNAIRHEDDTSDDHLKVSSQLQRDHGESSFVSFSGLITYSGPIAYSGSLSLRSDSSATSTRSFAFPILESEWNSSPVRMAKADKRRFRKHRGWRQGLLCCRF